MARISVCTVTCRTHPRFREMANTLVASFRRAAADSELEWIIVDDKLWKKSTEERLAPVHEVLGRQPEDVQRRIRIVHVPPPATAARGPDVADPLPAHNTAKNEALRQVSADSIFVVFLSDCTVVTSDWISVAFEVAARKNGWACIRKTVPDLEITEDMPLRYQDVHDNFKVVMATTVAGPCWGAPPDALKVIGGFDESYDGEDDMHDHECLLRLGRTGLAFVTTKKAAAVRLTRTKIKADVTTRQGAIHGTRNRGFYNLLVQDRRRTRIPPTAAQIAGHPMDIARPGVATHASNVGMASVHVVAGRQVAPASTGAAPQPIRYAPPARPSARSVADARANDDVQSMDAAVTADQEIAAAAAEPEPDDRPRAQHANEICGYARDVDGLGHFNVCVLVMDHPGPHVVGTPGWAREYPMSTRVASYREYAQLAADPSQHTEASVVLDDLWYVMTDEERDEVDPEGAAARAAARGVAQAPAQPVVSLHERAKQAQAARRQFAAAVAGGTAPAPAQGEQCSYVPTQGVYKGQRCIKRKHGQLVPHQFPSQSSAPPPAAQQPAARQAPAREPPAPSEQVYATMSRMDQHIVSVAQQLDRLPNDYGRQIILLAVALRREGVLVTKEADLVQMIADSIPLEPGRPPAPVHAARQIALQRVRELAKALPRPPCTTTEFQALAAHQNAVDQWRQTVGLPLHASMTLFDRAHQAAADASVDVWVPDDYRDAGVDDLVEHERRQAQRVAAPTMSVAPLSDAEAAAEQAAADAMIEEEARRGLEPAGG